MTLTKVVVTPEGQQEVPLTDAEIAQVNADAAAFAAQQTIQAWQSYQSQAQILLDKSDITIARCVENVVAVPAAWATYRKSLRAITGASSGDPTQPLPVTPSYPAGT